MFKKNTMGLTHVPMSFAKSHSLTVAHVSETDGFLVWASLKFRYEKANLWARENAIHRVPLLEHAHVQAAIAQSCARLLVQVALRGHVRFHFNTIQDRFPDRDRMAVRPPSLRFGFGRLSLLPMCGGSGRCACASSRTAHCALATLIFQGF